MQQCRVLVGLQGNVYVVHMITDGENVKLVHRSIWFKPLVAKFLATNRSKTVFPRDSFFVNLCGVFLLFDNIKDLCSLLSYILVEQGE